MWVRGLKLEYALASSMQNPVAPYVGAWIETVIPPQYHKVS